ncbi:MAG TPA: molybdopterin-dependent oxidoreductase [Candidatus Paceibacterota bacterium]|nr:molybdopterin-dependent oxidoreductase [Verrucomicrobiota bacterium]HRZ45474.1 molybdopterin-dependent oxidoreductase [Candidatus Paceibacterota bacterium]
MKIDPDRGEPEEVAGAESVEVGASVMRGGMSRRRFSQVLGAGLLVTVRWDGTAAQSGQSRSGRGSPRVAARIHIGQDGAITVMSGKVEMGQGARAELSQAAAEELRVPAGRIQMVMADTRLTPDDGITAGSRTTPSTVPAVRQGAAAARRILERLAARRWQVAPAAVRARDGEIVEEATGRRLSYAVLAGEGDFAVAFDEAIPANVEVTPVREWKVLGTSVGRPNGRDLITGAHRFPSDLTRPGMLYGKVLRAPSYGARLGSVDLTMAQAMPGVVAVRDGSFVGVAAPTKQRSREALAAIERTAEWAPAPHPSSDDVYDYLRRRASGGVPANPFAADLDAGASLLRQTYRTAYVQHAPLETRAALAEWEGDRLTVWAGTQNPFGYHSELARALGLTSDRVRVVVPDFGSGFGGKHTGEAAIEAARLARAAGRPVLVHWTREEEFSWAYFRPAAVIEIEASLDRQGRLASWHFVNINSGGAAVDTPYRAGKTRCRYVPSDPPLRQGSYRALAAVANNFAREAFMDELAAAAKADPLEFRLAHLENPRIRAVLEEMARRFRWAERMKSRPPEGVGYGLACGTEKGSVVATGVEIAIDPAQNHRIIVRRICEVFECGAILNPDNLRAQVEGCILMGLGPALREEMRFKEGRMLNPRFGDYGPPRMSDLPELDIQLLDRPDLASAGGGETPIIAVAPAIANAVYHATGHRIHALPIRLPA